MTSYTVSNSSSLAVRWYWATVGIVLTIGFIINYFMIKNIPSESIMSINLWVLLIGYFACVICGIMMSQLSDNPIISFIGFLLVVTPIGVIITPFVQQSDPQLVERAIVMTGLLTALMGTGGFLLPKLFKSLGGILFWMLITAIIAEIIFLILGYKQTFMDYIVALIFLGFIGYNFASAQDDPPTMDAAIDRAVALYMDIINLFIRILSILSNNK